jgi:hypothetical protein
VQLVGEVVHVATAASVVERHADAVVCVVRPALLRVRARPAVYFQEAEPWGTPILIIMFQVSCGVRDKIKESHISLSSMDVLKGD